MSENLIPCPKCGSLAKEYLHSTIKPVFIPERYDVKGYKLFNETKLITDNYKCLSCGELYSHDK